MSNQYSFSLVTKQRKDAEKLLARAEEVLKELDPDGNSGVKFDLIEDDTTFGIGDGSLVLRQADLAIKVVNAVVAAFPEMTMHYYETCNGPLSREAISKNGELVEIESWEIVVITQNEEDHQRVLPGRSRLRGTAFRRGLGAGGAFRLGVGLCLCRIGSSSM